LWRRDYANLIHSSSSCRDGSFHHGPSCEQDGSAGRNCNVLDDRDGERSLDVSVAEEWVVDFGRNLGQLHHATSQRG
jgi:hypothetical protein